MIKRVVWLSAGVAIGVFGVRKFSQVKTALGPTGLNRAVGQLADSVADFADALRTGMQQREADLRVALGVDAAERPDTHR